MGFPPWSLHSINSRETEFLSEIQPQRIKLSMLLMHLESIQDVQVLALEENQDKLILKLCILHTGEITENWLQQALNTPPAFSVEKTSHEVFLRIPFTRTYPDHKMDIKRICRHFGLTEKESQFFLKETFKELRNRKESIEKLFQDKKWPELHRQIHSLKGTALSLGLDGLRYMAQEAEKKAKEERFTLEELQRLQKETDSVIVNFPLE